MADKLEIPASAFEVKAHYFERPSPAEVKALHQFIQTKGTPHLWPGHTHDAPQKGSEVTFLGKYTLPETHHRQPNWAPCPCCSPHHPKYFRKGLIAWFPKEGVIRCVGDKCYKTMDPEGYATAMAQLNIEIRNARTAETLLARIPQIPDYVRVIKLNVPVIEAIDKMRNLFLMTVNQRLGIDLWQHASTGMLRVTIVRNEVKWRSGGEEIGEVADFQDYGSIVGHIALKPGHYNLASKIAHWADNLSAVHESTNGGNALFNLPENEKKAAVRVIKFAHNAAIKAFAEAEEVRRFFAKVNVATINKWSEHDGSPEEIHLAMENDGWYVGRNAASHFMIKWPAHFWLALRTLEPLMQAKAA